MSQKIDEIYTSISQSRYWKDLIPDKLSHLSDEELLLLSEKFYVAIEKLNETLGTLDSGSCETLLTELRKLEQRVAAVNEYYIERTSEGEAIHRFRKRRTEEERLLGALSPGED